jgi:S1-C subfamily serine protease
MRVALLALFALLLGCGSQPKVPTKSELVPRLESESVALVRLALAISLTPTEIKIEPVTRPFCSGVWVSSSSFVTAHHCVDENQIGDELAYVVKSDVFDGYEAKQLVKIKIAKLTAVDPEHDLAILRALVPPPHEVAALSYEPIESGLGVHTMGHSLGYWYSYSSGEVSGVRVGYMPAGEDDPIGKKVLWVQTTAPISPGNSGGGLFDAHANLVGLCSRSRRDGQGLNFYIHRDHIAAFLSAQALL